MEREYLVFLMALAVMYVVKKWTFQPRVIGCSLCRMVCGDSVFAVSKDGVMCGVVSAVFVVETAYALE